MDLIRNRIKAALRRAFQNLIENAAKHSGPGTTIFNGFCGRWRQRPLSMHSIGRGHRVKSSNVQVFNFGGRGRGAHDGTGG